MTFNRLNNIVGWIVCLIACTVYVLTMEPTGSLWDCGEFVSSAYKLQVPHPPGAPLFTLLGRFFIILFGDDPMTAAKAVNFMSAIASGFTILFLFWTITHFARKMVQKPGADLKGEQLFGVMAAGTIGALAYTFSDSFWYSAVEGEVYALSSLFTAVVFWAILKWEHEVDLENKADKHMFSSADRWIVFIFFMMGLSIGVHLLNLLTIPAIVMVYYFKRYKVTKWGLLWAFLIGCLITGIVQVAIIQWSIKGAGAFDIFFVNKIGTPFFVGFIIYFLLLFGLLVGGLRYNAAAIKKFSSFPIWLSLLILLFCFPLIDSVGGFLGFLVIIGSLIFVCYNYKDSIGSFVQIALFSTIFMILGYSTYFSTLIRSTANPSVDMYNVDNPVTLVGYLSREQYGETPLFYGPDFIYRPPSKDAGDLYVKGKDKYNIVGKIRKQDFAAKPSEQEIDEIIRQHPDWDASKIGPHIFPRMFDNSNERSQEYVYRNFGGMEQGEQPTFKNNIQYFLNYQLRWMYWRYFMWNFAGKQNDLQGLGNIRDGNWASGIDFIDKNIFNTSPASDLPDTAGKNNKANNKLFLLPLLLGLLGFYYQYKRTSNDFLVTFLLFFFTGVAIVVYLNQSGFQPRERDYAFVGSFYAFAIWIGLGLLWVKDILAKAVNASVAGLIAFPLCLVAVPVWMGIQEWDDHDRSKKTLAFDLGKDYLESCEKDAIVISFGDNDTYPLWYTLEVAGVRKDLRVMNYSLLGTDWYVNQLRYKVNGSAPVDVIFTPEQIEGGTRDAVFTASYLNRVNFPNNPISYFDQNTYYDLYKMLKEVTGSEDPRYKVPVGDDEYMYSFPVTKVSVPVDLERVSKTIPLNPGEQFVPELRLDIKKSFLQKNDLAILALIATNQWKRPIYFTSTQELEQLGLDKYVRLEGMSYRLVPVQGSSAQNDIAYRNIMEKFGYGSADKKGVYFDEENRRHLNSIRQSQSIIALNLAQQNKKDSARKILRKYDQMVREENMPYGFTSNRGNFHNRISLTFLYAAYESNDKELARKVSASIKKDLEQQLKYYRSLGSESLSNEELANQASAYLRQQPSSLSDDQVIFAQDIESSNSMLRQMQDLEKQYGAAPVQSNKESGPTTLPAPGMPK